jgi:hypothetical protein
VTLLERVRAAHPDAPIWAAQARQSAFLTAPEFEVLYGGAAGGGKTDALLVCGLLWLSRHPGAQVLFLRRTYPDLSLPGGAIPRSHELYAGHATWNGSEHKWTFPNGGAVQFGHLEHAGAHMNYRGAQIDLLLWDELTQVLLEPYLFLRSRVRPTKDGVVTGIRAATNPGDVGHAWVKRRWVDAAPWGEPFHVRAPGAEPVSARFIPAKLEDNPALLNRDPGYRNRLRELPDHLQRAYEAGDWDIYEGQFFGEWRREVHVCRPFVIPAHWTRWTATDYGFAAWWVNLSFARDPRTRRVYVYREMGEKGLRDEHQAVAITHAIRRDREALKIDPAAKLYTLHVGDPSMFAKRSEEGKPSIASVYQQRGVALEPGMNNRKHGWAVVRRALATKEVDPVTGEQREKPPRLQVFDTCVNLIRTLPEMPRDPLDPEDLADVIRGQKTEDDFCDALRYGLVAEASPPSPGVRPVVIGG